MSVVLQRASDGDAILCGESQVAVFAAQGYVRTNQTQLPSQSQPVSVAQPVPSGLVRLFKGELEITAEPSQVAIFEAQGWSRLSAASDAASQPSGSQQSDQQPKSNPMDELRALLGMLDAEADDDWTVDKLVKIGTLKELTGRDVTRNEVEQAWPGFNRDVLRAH